MKLVDEINKLAIPRIANASSKKLKSDCPSCGTKLPTYQGRYPKDCPGCNCEIGESSEDIIFYKSGTKGDQTKQSLKNKFFNKMPDKKGYEKVYMPFGSEGKGFYYKKLD
jgi:hypothetical protein